MRKLMSFVVLFIVLVSCNPDDENINDEYKFVVEYSANVTVGGVVGVTERVFEIGEIYKGTDEGEDVINIRIAEHSELNEDCPNSWCYQEFLDVPREFVRLVE